MNKPLNLTHKLIKSRLAEGKMIPGEEIGIKIDQTLTQDATGTMVMLELEAMGVKKIKTELSVQYVDHNLLQEDFKNADDHLFLQSAAQKFGLWFSKAGNGVSHPVHMERFGIPGKSMAGSDSHTPAAGSIGMLALGAGGLDITLAMIGEPLHFVMPKVMGIHLKGKLPDWVSAKDVILEMLRRHGVNNKGVVMEYYGEGLECLSAMDRHVIANMGTELGATTTVFPSDKEVKRFLKSQGRENDWIELKADKGAEYDLHDEINLSNLEPLIACPSSPGNVVKVSEVEGTEIAQVVVGSSANPGTRDFWIVEKILKGKKINDGISLDINPTSRQVIENLIALDAMAELIKSGARFHQAGCLGCIGMGQAPATGKNSLRTMPRNFPGRSGTLDDQVYLCSPETAAASALTGVITDPRNLEKLYGMTYPKYEHPKTEVINTQLLIPPSEDSETIELIKGPNIKAFPDFGKIQNDISLPVLLKLGDNISTDEILRGGVKVLSLRSNIPEISKWTYNIVDQGFYERAMKVKETEGGHIVVAGENYAQGSSREHAAIAVRYTGQQAVIAKSYARLGWQNLINFGVIPFEFINKRDYDDIKTDDVLEIKSILDNLMIRSIHIVINKRTNKSFEVTHSLSERQLEILRVGGIVNFHKITGDIKPDRVSQKSSDKAKNKSKNIK